MMKILAGGMLAESNGLKFSARNVNIPPVDLHMQVFMDQRGPAYVELRNKQNELVFRISGKELSELDENGQLDASRPERLKDSIFNAWEKQRPEPVDPNTFVLDLREADPEQLKGRLKLLIDWLDDHIENEVAVNPHKETEEEEQQKQQEEEQKPAEPPPQSQEQQQSPPASQPPQSQQPQSAPPEASPPPPQSQPKQPNPMAKYVGAFFQR